MNAFTKAKKCIPPCIGSIKSNLSPKGGISGIVGAASNSFLTLFGSFIYQYCFLVHLRRQYKYMPKIIDTLLSPFSRSLFTRSLSHIFAK